MLRLGVLCVSKVVGHLQTQRVPVVVGAVQKSSARFLSDATSNANSEAKIKTILKSAFPLAVSIEVEDVSGGCGAMYEVVVKTPEFKGLSLVKQHRLVNEALKEEIKSMHGIRIHTAPS